MDKYIEKTMKNLEANNIESHYVEKRTDVIPLLEKMIESGASVAVGGSVTLDETGVLEYLRCGKYRFLDRYEQGITREQITEIFKNSFGVDTYLCSSNAVTEEGELYNVDGNANRISAIAFGPKSVIIIAGVNKIVKNIDEAVKRVKTIAAPKNCKRLNCRTYCYEKGQCVHPDACMGKGCDSPQRICRHYLVSAKQATKGRMKVILVGESLGY